MSPLVYREKYEIWEEEKEIIVLILETTDYSSGETQTTTMYKSCQSKTEYIFRKLFDFDFAFLI
jgi:hypothetical protein